MEPDGRYRVLAHGLQSNGIIAARTGNLIVGDMFGHRVVELDPANGRVRRVLLDRINGRLIDGPNDLVIDAKGRIYVTDPQFTPDQQKSQPGKQVYYIAPDSSARVVIGPSEYAMPNGVEISPDGRTLYVNNTWQQPGGNLVWAYDVAEEGSLLNKRRYAVVELKPEVVEARNPARIRVRTDRRWTPRGAITSPRKPECRSSSLTAPPRARSGCRSIRVSVAFGGSDNDVLYIVGESSVWSIQTRVHGFRHPSGMN